MLNPWPPDIETVRQIKCRKIKGFRGWVVCNYNAYYNKFVSWYEEIYAQLTDCCKSCEWNLTIWITIKYVNRRRAHLFLSGLDYYKTNPPGNVKGSENNQHFDMTCGGFVIKRNYTFLIAWKKSNSLFRKVFSMHSSGLKLYIIHIFIIFIHFRSCPVKNCLC